MTTEDIDPTEEPGGTAGDAGDVAPTGETGPTGDVAPTAEGAPAGDVAPPGPEVGVDAAAAAASTEPSAPPPDQGLVRADEVVGIGAIAAMEDPEAERRRRRKAIILIGLLALLTVFSMFTAWYLITRKPISELPLPGISDETLPHYQFSIYGIDRPIGIVASPSGDRIYVAQTAGDRTVIAYDSKGIEVARFVPPDTVPGSRIPVYVALDPVTGEVYVSDRVAAAIYVYSPDGTYQRTFEPKPKPADWEPLGLAFDQQGNLYVGDLSEPFHRVVELGRDGTILRSIGTVDQFSFPNGIAVDARGNVYVADGNHGQLQIIDPSGQQVAVIPRGASQGELGLPRGTALDDSGRLFVMDATGQALQIYRVDQLTNRPNYIGTAGYEGRGDGQFEYPFGVATDSRARIYIADWANDRVQVWSY
jgi:sugar lactone lactonase YvrE